MNYKIRRLADYAACLLHAEKSGVVHSVYRKTINLSAGGRLVSIQAADSPLSPISLISELTGSEMARLGIEPGQPFAVREGILQITGSKGIHSFSLLYAEKVRLFLTPCRGTEAPDTLARQIIRALSLADTGGFRPLFFSPDTAVSDPMLACARDRIRRALSMFREESWNVCASELSRLIGLGTGLTPCGDDFLCGVLAGLTLCHMAGHPFAHALKRELRSHLNDTNDISRAFLRCALDSYFSCAVVSLREISGAGDIADAFLAIGHSSGTDTLCGILFTLRFLRGSITEKGGKHSRVSRL